MISPRRLVTSLLWPRPPAPIVVVIPMHALQQRACSVPSVGQLPIGKVSMGLASKVGCHGVRDGGRLAAGIRLRGATNANDQGSGAKGDGLRLNKLYSQLVNGSRQTTDVTAGLLHFHNAKQSGRCSSPTMMLQADGKGYGARQASPTQNHGPCSPAR